MQKVDDYGIKIIRLPLKTLSIKSTSTRVVNIGKSDQLRIYKEEIEHGALSSVEEDEQPYRSNLQT